MYFSQENGKCLGFWIRGHLWEVVAYERWSHLEVQLYLGCSYLFLTETSFTLFSVLSGLSVSLYRPQGLVFFVMKDSRLTFKGKTIPGGGSIKERGRGRREKSERAFFPDKFLGLKVPKASNLSWVSESVR